MIPKHIMHKAVEAAGDNWVLVFDWEHDKLYAQVHAALEAVAADFWEQGQSAGMHDGLRVGEIIIGTEPGPPPGPTPNPYRIEHT